MTATWDDVLAAVQAGTPEAEFIKGRLAQEWVVPPFSVLDTMAGHWQTRKRAWLALGIESEIGRAGDALFHQSSQNRLNAIKRGQPSDGSDPAGFKAVSIFDPVLCELAYRWWCPAGGSVLDPFAGGSVRGIVAAMLGHPYTGVDLSAVQVAANREQAARIVPADRPMPRWYTGDSRALLPDLPAGELYDMVFTCPPYYDLEVYSDDPADLSNMGTYGAFLEAYEDIVASAVRRLRPDRLAVVVVSDVRDKHGFYVGLRRDTELAFERASHRLYNDAATVAEATPAEAQDVVRKWDEAKLVNTPGTLALRTMGHMVASRKLGRMHQDVLVFARTAPATRDWDYARPAPPTPQTDLGLVPPPEPEPTQLPLDGAAATAPDLAAAEQPAGPSPAELPIPVAAPTRWATDPAEYAWATAAPKPAAEPVARPLGQWPNVPLGPTPGPRPADDQLAIREPVTTAPGLCQTCGEPLGECRGHEPFVTPAEAAGLFATGQWDPADSSPADIDAMRQAGLWEA
jgi:hypothetical protein